MVKCPSCASEQIVTTAEQGKSKLCKSCGWFGNAMDIRIAEALDSENGKDALKIADFYRFKFKMTYNEIFERVKKIRPSLDIGTWDALIREGEDE